ncbi:MAG: hypothetical protein WB586_17060 [Chthoniobacterales bacterium]
MPNDAGSRRYCRLKPALIGKEDAKCKRESQQLSRAEQMAGQESPRTTKLYDRTKDEITIGEVERIQL